MAEEKKNPPKRPTALKRDIQNEKRRLKNKIDKSRLRTAIRSLNEAAKAGDASKGEKLTAVYSLVDKCVKKGIYKRNKGSRIKSQCAAKAS